MVPVVRWHRSELHGLADSGGARGPAALQPVCAAARSLFPGQPCPLGPEDLPWAVLSLLFFVQLSVRISLGRPGCREEDTGQLGSATEAARPGGSLWARGACLRVLEQLVLVPYTEAGTEAQ